MIISNVWLPLVTLITCRKRVHFWDALSVWMDDRFRLEGGSLAVLQWSNCFANYPPFLSVIYGVYSSQQNNRIGLVLFSDS